MFRRAELEQADLKIALRVLNITFCLLINIYICIAPVSSDTQYDNASVYNSAVLDLSAGLTKKQYITLVSTSKSYTLQLLATALTDEKVPREGVGVSMQDLAIARGGPRRMSSSVKCHTSMSTRHTDP